MNQFTDDYLHTVENLFAKNKTNSISIYGISIVSIALLLVFILHSQIEISIPSRGIIRSSGEDIPIIPLLSGNVIGQSLIHNAKVKINDTLLVINSQELAVEKDQINSEIKRKNGIILDFDNIINRRDQKINNSFVQASNYKYVSHLKQLNIAQKNTSINKSRSELLYDQKVIPKSEFEKSIFDFDVASQTIIEFEKEQITQWQIEKKSNIEEIRILQNKLEFLKKEIPKYYLKAPISGTLLLNKGILPNSNVINGNMIAEISPDQNLIVECAIGPENIGLIKKNQRVVFQIDAFNSNQWGSITGSVLDIDQNPKQSNNQIVFFVRCKLLTNYLKLKNGYSAKIGKGMTLTGNFFITKRKVIDLLFDKMENWLNPKKI